jgi:hypothetical protein
MQSKRIAILLHENDTGHTIRSSLIYEMAKIWQQDGYEVFYLRGTSEYLPADLIFLHVDLTVVPDSYLEFAHKYPRVINGNVKDIRKTTLNNNLLQLPEDWDGPVIVKSDYNCAGVPERNRRGVWGKIEKKMLSLFNSMNIDSHLPNFHSSTDYKIFNHLKDVPKILSNYPSIVIQKFIPEMEGDNYCVRTVSFLGDHMSPKKLIGPHPIVKGETATKADFNIKTDPEIVEKIKELKFDYGKFDYVLVDGKPILLDINKTVGISPNLATNHSIGETFRHHAEGLYPFL